MITLFWFFVIPSIIISFTAGYIKGIFNSIYVMLFGVCLCVSSALTYVSFKHIIIIGIVLLFMNIMTYCVLMQLASKKMKIIISWGAILYLIFIIFY